MSENNTLEEVKANISIIDPLKEVKAKVRVQNPDQSWSIVDRTYKFEPTKPRWSEMLDWASDLASGMVFTIFKDDRGEDITKMDVSKDYASKQNNVVTKIMICTFNLDTNVDNIDTDSLFEMRDMIEASGFLERLGRLNKNSSTAQKSIK